VPISRDLTVEELHGLLVTDHGFDPSVKLVSGSCGARARYQSRERGWALEGHQVLPRNVTLGALECSAMLVYQRRLGPTAELDLSEMARRAKEERQALEAVERQRRADEERFERDSWEAAQRAAAHRTAAQRAAEEEEERQAIEAAWADAGAAHTQAATASEPAGGTEAELLARALEVELEVDRRVQLAAGEAERGELGATMKVTPQLRGPQAWRQPEPTYFVDAMNDSLGQIRRLIEASAKYSTKVLEESAEAFVALCHFLNRLVLCHFPAGSASLFQQVHRLFTRPSTGVHDLLSAWSDAVTLANGRTPVHLRTSGRGADAPDSQSAAQVVADTKRELNVTLREVQRALRAALDAAAAAGGGSAAAGATGLLDSLVARRRMAAWPPDLGQMRVVRTTPQTMTRLLHGLRERFKEPAFQEGYRELPRGDARVLMALTVQKVVLPLHGFSGDFQGVRNMRMEVGLHNTAGDQVVWKLMKDIHQLLDVADAWHEDVLTLDFGNANRVEQEVSLLYQHDFALTNLEKLVGARLAAACARGRGVGGLQGPAAVHAGFELFLEEHCAPGVSHALAGAGLGALASTARGLYAATGGPRRRLALGRLREAVGCQATRRAIGVAEMLRLGEEPSVAARRQALSTLDAQVLQCFQNQPEVNAATLAARWQRGDFELEATEEGGAVALHLAAGDGNLELICALLTLGARVDRRDRLERTPAHWAAACGHITVLAALAAGGADLKAADAHGRTPQGFVKAAGLERKAAELRGLFASRQHPGLVGMHGRLG